MNNNIDVEKIINYVTPGLWLAVPALIAGNLPEVQAVLQSGLATPEHQAFVDRLSSR